MILYAVMLLVTAINFAFLFRYGNPDWKPLAIGYLGLLLQAGALLAIGTFISTLTRNQIIAGAATFGVCLLLWVLEWVSGYEQATWAKVLSYMSVITHFDSFSKGVLDTKDIIFYVSLIFLGLVLHRAFHGIPAVEVINEYASGCSPANEIRGLRHHLHSGGAGDRLGRQRARQPLQQVHDFTANKRYTLSDQTAKIVKGMKQDVTITYFDQTSQLRAGQGPAGSSTLTFPRRFMSSTSIPTRARNWPAMPTSRLRHRCRSESALRRKKPRPSRKKASPAHSSRT